MLHLKQCVASGDDSGCRLLSAMLLHTLLSLRKSLHFSRELDGRDGSATVIQGSSDFCYWEHLASSEKHFLHARIWSRGLSV